MPFTGRAIYDTGVFDGVAEDVADLIGMISPYETPLLDSLGDAPRPATNVLHEWLEDSLSPNTVVSSSVVASNGTAVGIHVAGQSVGLYLQAGMVLKNTTTGEYIQISSTTANTLVITRGFGGSTAATIQIGDNLFVISDAALEGADVSVDTSRPRTRRTNYTQIFKKDIIVSGTVQAVNMLGNISNEFDYQKMKKAREIARDLEKAVINGISSANSLGTASATRTFRGIWASLTTNSTSLGTITPDLLDTAIQGAWGQGAVDLDIIVCDPTWKRAIDAFNVTRVQVDQTTDTYRRRTSFYESTFGSQMVLMSRWMPNRSLMVLSSQRCRVTPLSGRSFAYSDVARTGDSQKGMLLGEYTVEVVNEEGMCKVF